MRKIKILFLPGMLILPFFLFRCVDVPEEFVMPSWDVSVNLSVATDTVFMSDILEEDDMENLQIIDSPEWGDSIYLIIVEDIETVSTLQDKLQLNSPLVPGELNLSGYTGGNRIVSATVYNPDPEYHIDTALFLSGELRFLMTNNSSSDTDYEIILPGFKNRNTGNFIRLAGNSPANSSQVRSINLTDVIYAELPVTGNNDLVNYSSQSSDGFLIIGIAEARNALELNLVSYISNENIKLARLVGQLKKTEIDFFEETHHTDLGKDLSDFRDKIDFSDIRMRVTAKTFGEMNNVKIVFDSVTIKGKRNDKPGESMMQFSGNDYFHDYMIAGSQYQKEFNKTNSSLNSFLSDLPDEITIGNKIHFEKNPNSDYDTQKISDKDSVKIIAALYAPFKFAVKDVIHKDTTDVNFTEDELDNIDNAISARLTVRMESRIALGAKASFKLVDGNYQELFRLHDNEGMEFFNISPSGIDSDGRPAQPVVTELAVMLTDDDIDKLVRSKFVIMEIVLNSTGSTTNDFGPYVRVRAKDYITYKVFGSINYRVDVE